VQRDVITEDAQALAVKRWGCCYGRSCSGGGFTLQGASLGKGRDVTRTRSFQHGVALPSPHPQSRVVKILERARRLPAEGGRFDLCVGVQGG